MFKRIHAFLSACYKMKERLRLRLSVWIYSRHFNRIMPQIAKHRPVRVMFYVNNLSMWKSDKLLQMLKNDQRFDPFIVSYLYSSDSTKGRKQLEQEMISHFQPLGVRFESGFDYEKNKPFPVSKFKADILFYPQPYRNRLKEIPRNVLLSYMPYCFDMGYPWDKLYRHVCWKFFVTSPYLKEMDSKYYFNNGSNIILSGNPQTDYFFDGHTPSSDMWPLKDPSLKKIIWAPHHSILPTDDLDYSYFLKIADDMLRLATKYKDKVQFVFKPHPMLKEKLYKIETWGVERTDAYYEEWKRLPNCNFQDGNYVDLFMTSDALIHDCSSFTVEYMYVNKPVMFITDRTSIPQFKTPLPDTCFKLHYHGCTIQQIEAFINDVISGNDPLKEERSRFFNETIAPKDNKTASGIIYDELCTLFE